MDRRAHCILAQHHVDASSITRHDFVETNGHNIRLSILPSVAGLIALGRGTMLCTVIAMSLFSMAALVGLTSQIHKWAHVAQPPRIVGWLQNTRLFISARHHAEHHRAPNDRYYCITVGERIITKVTGRSAAGVTPARLTRGETKWHSIAMLSPRNWLALGSTLTLLAACGAPGNDSGPAAQTTEGVSQRLDVTEAACTPGAIPDDGIDDAPAFACALEQLKAKGGILHVPAGTFDIHASLVVPTHVTLEGTGFGSVLAQPHALLGPVLRMQRESILRDVMLTQEHPLPDAANPAWAPNQDYDFQVKIEGDQVTASDIKLLNPLLGILISPADPNGAVGQVQLFNVRGQPLKEGIRIDHALDVIHVQQLHFWPFWSADHSVLRWTSGNGIGIHSMRDDNPLLSELFFFGYAVGIRLGSSTGSPTSGITSKAKISQMDCDACGTAIHVTGKGTRGVLLSQVSSQGLRNDFGPGLAGVGVDVAASNTSLNLAQGDFTALAANAVRVAGENSVIMVTGTMVREWNTSERGFPAFELVGGSGANPGSSFVVDTSVTGNGHGAPITGPGVTVLNVRADLNL